MSNLTTNSRLVVTRREGERLTIKTSDCDIEIELDEMLSNQCRIAVYAPRSVKVLRNELLEEKGGFIADLPGKHNSTEPTYARRVVPVEVEG